VSGGKKGVDKGSANQNKKAGGGRLAEKLRDLNKSAVPQKGSNHHLRALSNEMESDEKEAVMSKKLQRCPFQELKS